MKVRIDKAPPPLLGGSRIKRHTVDCYVPDQVQNRGRYRTVDLTDQVRQTYKPCLICGGRGR